MPICNQCGAENTEGAKKCKFCQGSLKRTERKNISKKNILKVYRDGDIKIHTCPECDEDFTHEYDSGFCGIISCPACEKDIKYVNGVVQKLLIGPKGIEYSEYEDPSINADRLCIDCSYYKSKNKVALLSFFDIETIFIIIFIMTIIPILISVVPICIWPQITSWYKWITITILFAVFVYWLYLIYDTFYDNIFEDQCTKLSSFSCEDCNPNLRCKYWVKK